MKQLSHHQIATYLTDYALSELVKYVIEDTGCSIEQAIARVYNSPLMPLLQDEEGELYVQSPAYLYELMNTYWQLKSQAEKSILSPLTTHPSPLRPWPNTKKKSPFSCLIEKEFVPLQPEIAFKTE